MRKNKQLVILYTEDGRCPDDRVLKGVWEQRCFENFKHYKVLAVKIIEKGE